MITRRRIIVLCAFLAAGAGLLALASAQPGHSHQRFGSVVGLRSERIEEYTRLHAAVWPDVLVKLRECNIRNYSIYLKEIERGKFYLFSYYEYVGSDYASDMARLGADPALKEWWKLTDPCQVPVPLHEKNELWSGMKEVFHMD
jgi:L-rhamnose mutarotase